MEEGMEDEVPTYIQKSDGEMCASFLQNSGNDIVLDLDSYETKHIRNCLMEMEKKATLVKDHIVKVSLLHKVNENEMIRGIFIKIGEKMIELFIGASNLYMWGFRVGGTIYEAVEGNHMLPGSRSLGFGVGYRDLGMDFENFQFGWNSIRRVAHILRRWPQPHEPNAYYYLKSAFTILIVMLVETLRSHKVRSEVLQCYEDYKDENWKALRGIVKDWQKFYNKYHIWRREKDASDFHMNISAHNQFIINQFPTLISESGLAMSPPPLPPCQLTEDELNDYDKKVTNMRISLGS